MKYKLSILLIAILTLFACKDNPSEPSKGLDFYGRWTLTVTGDFQTTQHCLVDENNEFDWLIFIDKDKTKSFNSHVFGWISHSDGKLLGYSHDGSARRTGVLKGIFVGNKGSGTWNFAFPESGSKDTLKCTWIITY